MALVTRSLSEKELETLLDAIARFIEDEPPDGDIPTARKLGKQLEREHLRRYGE